METDSKSGDVNALLFSETLLYLGGSDRSRSDETSSQLGQLTQERFQRAMMLGVLMISVHIRSTIEKKSSRDCSKLANIHSSY